MADSNSLDRIVSIVTNFLVVTATNYPPNTSDRLIALIRQFKQIIPQNADWLTFIKAWISEDDITPKQKRDREICSSLLTEVNHIGYVYHSAMLLPQIDVIADYRNTLEDYLAECNHTTNISSPAVYIRNARTHCMAFLRFLQSQGIISFADITYDAVGSFNKRFSARGKGWTHDSFVRGFLSYLVSKGLCRPELDTFFHYHGARYIVDIKECTEDQRKRLICSQEKTFKTQQIQTYVTDILEKCKSLDYSEPCIIHFSRAYKLLIIFMEVNNLPYHPTLGIVWSELFRKHMDFSSYSMAKRAIDILNLRIGGDEFVPGYNLSGGYSRRTAPAWAEESVRQFILQKEKEKLSQHALNMYTIAIIRFLCIIDRAGIHSFSEISREVIYDYNIHDCDHETTYSKNAYNCRVKKYIKYLERQGLITQGLSQSLLPSSSTGERVVVVFTDEEQKAVKTYCRNAQTPMELRNSAMVLLGLKMGLRGIDIVNLKLGNIDWKNRIIRIRQQKTETDLELPMPVQVGNAIFAYLKFGRPKNSKSEYVFLSHKHLSREHLTNASCCIHALHAILPDRNVHRSGFHVTRKTYATNLLKAGVDPNRIAELLGQTDSTSVHKYLGIDDVHMGNCPLTLEEAGIPLPGTKLAQGSDSP